MEKQDMMGIRNTCFFPKCVRFCCDWYIHIFIYTHFDGLIVVGIAGLCRKKQADI